MAFDVNNERPAPDDCTEREKRDDPIKHAVNGQTALVLFGYEADKDAALSTGA